MKNILIIVPAYNEEFAIKKTLEEIQFETKSDKYLFNIVAINDCSKDKTGEMIKEVGVPCITLTNNLGIGGAVQTGYKYAYDNGYDYAVQVDGDGQHDARDIIKLVEVLEDNAVDLVVGSRFIGVRDYKTSFFRESGMIFSRKILLLGTGKRVLDTTSGFRVANKKLIRFFSNNYSTTFNGVIPLAMAFKNNFTFIEVPARFRYREHGESSINMKKALFYPFQTIFALLGVLLQKS